MKKQNETNSEYERLLQELNSKLEKCKKLDSNTLYNDCEENKLYRQYGPLLAKAKIKDQNKLQ